MLIASKREGDLVRALKWALTGTELFIVSVDGRNNSLVETVESFNPTFSSKDTIKAGYFTGKIFRDVEVLIDEQPFLPVETEIVPTISTICSNLANLVVKMKEDATDKNEHVDDNGHDNENRVDHPEAENDDDNDNPSNQLEEKNEKSKSNSNNPSDGESEVYNQTNSLEKIDNHNDEDVDVNDEE